MGNYASQRFQCYRIAARLGIDSHETKPVKYKQWKNRLHVHHNNYLCSSHLFRPMFSLINVYYALPTAIFSWMTGSWYRKT